MYNFGMNTVGIGYTTWHITWGMYGARMHGGERLTVARPRNQVGDAFVQYDEKRLQYERNRMRGEAVILSSPQCKLIERTIPRLCERGGWDYRLCAAPIEGDHVHVLLDVSSEIHGKKVMRWLKTWLTQALDEQWERPTGGRWWAEGGSARVVKDESYLINVRGYIEKQRVTQPG